MTGAQIREIAKVTCPNCGKRVGFSWRHGGGYRAAWRYDDHLAPRPVTFGGPRTTLTGRTRMAKCYESGARVLRLENALGPRRTYGSPMP